VPARENINGSGHADFEERPDRIDFGGETVGTIEVRTLQDGSVEGELEFRNPQEPGKLPLDFDPRGKQIEVLDGTTVVLETLSPSG